MHPAQIVLYGSTLCVMITVHFAMKLLAQHVLNWKKPKEQKAIVIIILMAPLYAVDSYVGLINFFGSEAFFTFLDSIKECYEALVRFVPIIFIMVLWPTLTSSFILHYIYLNLFRLSSLMYYNSVVHNLLNVLPTGDC